LAAAFFGLCTSASAQQAPEPGASVQITETEAAGLLIDAGQIETAKLVLTHVLQSNPNDLQARFLQGLIAVSEKRYDDAIACCQTSQSIAERLRDELRTGGARYVLVQCYEELGRLREATDLLEQVVYMDRKYQLPKLDENIRRLEHLRERLSAADNISIITEPHS